MISILLPVYRKTFLEEAINSLLQQTFKDFEVIIVDDCSDDGSWDILQKYKSINNFIIKRNSKNIGNIRSFVEAFTHSSGEYIFLFADDDVVCPDTLQKLVDRIEKDKSDAVYYYLQTIDSKGNKGTVWKSAEFDNRVIENLFMNGSNIISESMFFTRDFFQKYYIKYYSERLVTPIWLGNIKDVKLSYLKEPIYLYRLHSDNYTSSLTGLYDRNNNIINYMNACIINYSPFISQGREAALSIYINMFYKLFKHFTKGNFYTGISYNERDKVHIPFLMMCEYWLLNLYSSIFAIGNISKYQIRDDIYDNKKYFDKTLYTREIYKKLPLFAYRPDHKFDEFCALDIVNYCGKEIERVEYGDGIFANVYNCDSLDSLDKILKENLVSCVNTNKKEVKEHLKEKRLYFIPVGDDYVSNNF